MWLLDVLLIIWYGSGVLALMLALTATILDREDPDWIFLFANVLPIIGCGLISLIATFVILRAQIERCYWTRRYRINMRAS